MKTKAEQLLRQKDIKITANRLLVLNVFIEHEYALSLADIEAELPWADRATIFRSLKTFEQKALIHHIDDGGKAGKYALCSDTCEVSHHSIHPHFHCENCGKTICLPEQDVPIPDLPGAYKVNSYSLVISGLCDSCVATL